jgi:hypothetical protein
MNYYCYNCYKDKKEEAMYQKVLFPLFYYLGILSVVMGILSKLFNFMIFDLKPSRYLFFAGICALYAIAGILYHWICREKS